MDQLRSDPLYRGLPCCLRRHTARAGPLAAIAAIADLERSAVCPPDLGEIRAMLDERIARLRDATEGKLSNRRLLP